MLVADSAEDPAIGALQHRPEALDPVRVGHPVDVLAGRAGDCLVRVLIGMQVERRPALQLIGFPCPSRVDLGCRSTVGLICDYGIQAVFKLGFDRYLRAESTPLRGESPVGCRLALVCRYAAGFAFAHRALRCELSLTIPLRPTFRCFGIGVNLRNAC